MCTSVYPYISLRTSTSTAFAHKQQLSVPPGQCSFRGFLCIFPQVYGCSGPAISFFSLA